MVGANALFAQTCRHVVVGIGETGAAVELPFIFQALPALLDDLLAGHFLAVEQAIALAHLIQGGFQKLTETGGVAHGVDDLRFLRGAHGVVPFQFGVNDQAGGMVRAHGAGGVGHASRFQRARVPGGQGLPFRHGDAMVFSVNAYGQRAIAYEGADFGALADLIAQEFLRPFSVAPLHAARVHIDGNGGAGLYGVNPQLVAKPVQVRHIFPVVDGATGA